MTGPSMNADSGALAAPGQLPYVPAMTPEEQETQRALVDAAAERVGSLTELARRLGRDTRTTRRWRSGESPMPDVVRAQLEQLATGQTRPSLGHPIAQLGFQLANIRRALDEADEWLASIEREVAPPAATEGDVAESAPDS